MSSLLNSSMSVCQSFWCLWPSNVGLKKKKLVLCLVFRNLWSMVSLEIFPYCFFLPISLRVGWACVNAVLMHISDMCSQDSAIPVRNKAEKQIASFFMVSLHWTIVQKFGEWTLVRNNTEVLCCCIVARLLRGKALIFDSVYVKWKKLTIWYEP